MVRLASNASRLETGCRSVGVEHNGLIANLGVYRLFGRLFSFVSDARLKHERRSYRSETERYMHVLQTLTLSARLQAPGACYKGQSTAY